jgi:hypothetical protein
VIGPVPGDSAGGATSEDRRREGASARRGQSRSRRPVRDQVSDSRPAATRSPPVKLPAEFESYSGARFVECGPLGTLPPGSTCKAFSRLSRPSREREPRSRFAPRDHSGPHSALGCERRARDAIEGLEVRAGCGFL